MPNSLPPLSLDEVTQSAEDPFAVLNAMLNAYNTERAGPADHVPLWLFARDPSGKVQGGVRGQTYWSWCTIDVLSVAEPYRRHGIGSRLLAKAEEIARAPALAFGSIRQASRRLSSTVDTALRNSAASRIIRQVIRGIGS